jgi:DNA-binding response OmpR family regulator
MERRVHIMIVDDEEIVRDSLTGWLQEDGYEVEAAESGMKALELLPSKEWNLAMVDLKMPGMDGIELMDEIKKSRPDMIIIIMTAYATVDTAVKAMKKGAYDYIVKPFNPEDLSLTIRKIIEHQKLVKENIYLRKELKKQYMLHDMISKNHKMLEIFELVKTVAKSSSTVLIQGESGDRGEKQLHRPDPGRKRYRKGAAVAGHTHGKPPPGCPLHFRVLRRSYGIAARERAVRVREGRVHGSGIAKAWEDRTGPGRNPVPR